MALLLRPQRFILLFVLALMPAASHAQAKVPVFLEITVEPGDQVGSQFVFELKEAIRGSSSFRLVEESDWPRITVVIVASSTAPDSTAASFSFVYDDVKMPGRGMFITAAIQTCGRNRVLSCARTALGNIDNAVGRLKPEHKKTLY